MKVNIRKQNSVKIQENSEKYIIGLNQLKGYKDLITRSSVVSEDKAKRAGGLPPTSVGFRSDALCSKLTSGTGSGHKRCL